MEYFGEKAGEMPVLAARDGFKQLYSDDIVAIYRQLKEAEKDGYTSFSEKQPLVQAKKIFTGVMATIINGFHDDVVRNNFVWAELLYYQGPRSEKVYKLPENSNAVMYRNWKYSDDKADVSGAVAFPLKWELEKSESMCGGEYAGESVLKGFGLPEDMSLLPDCKKLPDNFEGLHALGWDFRIRGKPRLDLYATPKVSSSNGGAILGSSHDIDEIIDRLDLSRLRIAPRAPQQESAYQIELDELERELKVCKKSHADLGGSITKLEERITAVRKLK